MKDWKYHTLWALIGILILFNIWTGFKSTGPARTRTRTRTRTINAGNSLVLTGRSYSLTFPEEGGKPGQILVEGTNGVLYWKDQEDRGELYKDQQFLRQLRLTTESNRLAL